MEIKLLTGINYEDNLYSTITIDKLRGMDEEIIAGADLDKKVGDVVIALVARSILFIEDMDISKFSLDKKIKIVKSMMAYDIIEVIIGMKEKNYGKEFSVSGVCRKCLNKKEYSYSTDDIKSISLDSFNSEDVFYLQDGVDYKDENYRELRFRLTTGADLLDILNKMVSDVGKAMSLAFYYSIKDIGYGKVPKILEVIRNMTRVDRKKIQEYYDNNFPGRQLFFDEDCSKCNGEKTIRVGISVLDFLFREGF